ncbi:hypothetical protein H9W95_13035 [Flavobacterium lindanitolerans]|nr:hypothetical protein [Flavobacterium lindanitolerans]
MKKIFIAIAFLQASVLVLPKLIKTTTLRLIYKTEYSRSLPVLLKLKWKELPELMLIKRKRKKSLKLKKGSRPATIKK